MHFQRSKIRRRWDQHLTERGVDCFSIYAQDDWQPACYIPPEIDPYLFYPECAYTGATCSYYEGLRNQLQRAPTCGTVKQHGDTVALKAVHFPDSTVSSLNRGEPLHETFRMTGMDSFAGREKISSVTVFSPTRPLHSNSAIPELLFFNARQRDWSHCSAQMSSDPKDLAQLASEIFESVIDTYNDRIKTTSWRDQLHATVRCESMLMEALYENMLRLPSEDFYSRLLRILAQTRPLSNNGVRLSLHLLDVSQGDLRLVEMAQYEKGAIENRNHRYQAIKSAQDLSITTVTSLLGRAHLLSFVDEPGQTSVFLTPEEQQLVEDRRLQGTEWALTRADDIPRAKPGSGADLITIKTRNPVWEILRSELTTALYRVYLKMRRRSEWHYGQIFRPLTDTWNYGGSELCLPIVVARQVIGCVNIESQQPFFMTYAYTNMLTALSATVGLAIMHMRQELLLDEVQSTVDAVLSRKKNRNVSERLHFFARTVRDIVLSDAVDFVRPHPHYSGASFRIASSDIDQLQSHPRSSAWSEYVASEKMRGRIGVILDVDRQGAVLAAADINPVDAENGDFDNVRLKLLNDDLPDPQVNSRWIGKCRVLVGIRIETSEAITSGRAAGVVWYGYQHPGRLSGVSNGYRTTDETVPDDWRLRQAIGLLRANARRCSPVPLVWRANHVYTSTLATSLSHSEVRDSFPAVKTMLSEIDAHVPGDVARRLRVVVDTAARHWDLFVDLEKSDSFPDLVRIVHTRKLKLGRLGHSVPLCDPVTDAWEAACSHAGHWPPPSLRLESLAGKNSRPHYEFLFLVLFNVFTNALNYSTAIADQSNVNLELLLEDVGDRLALKITDPGGLGYEPLQNLETIERNGNLSMILAQGIDCIYWLGKALGGGTAPRLEHLGGRTSWTVFLEK